MCGEKPVKKIVRVSAQGSPPRVRGKANVYKGDKTPIGITPACAGKSTNTTEVSLQSLGSPPRVRGKGSDLA